MADFVLKLPENFLLSNGGETKHLFKAAMRGIVPDSILDRRDKVGFATPERSILLSNKSKVREWIYESNDGGIINKDKAWKKIIQILECQGKYDYLAWRIINFSRWTTLCTG
jgi:asparagine synthase (glutamine-hydrolysing)